MCVYVQCGVEKIMPAITSTQSSLPHATTRLHCAQLYATSTRWVHLSIERALLSAVFIAVNEIVGYFSKQITDATVAPQTALNISLKVRKWVTPRVWELQVLIEVARLVVSLLWRMVIHIYNDMWQLGADYCLHIYTCGIYFCLLYLSKYLKILK